MARKTVDVEVKISGRDFGKIFHLTEMSAMQADKWGQRALLALVRAGTAIPDEVMQLGIIAVLMVGRHRLAGVNWVDLEPLIDEMMTCVKYIPTKGANVVRDFLPEEIEEASTFAFLRRELFTLHTGFIVPAAPSESLGAATGVFV